jgi:tetrapyrrole methylase family protein/MazG family protein
MSTRGRLTIVGLGPGHASLLTVEARDALAAASTVWLRTSRHPTVTGLPDGPRYESFDEVYEREGSFDAVYERIVERVLSEAQTAEGCVYAVPGHPLFGEATVRELLRRAPDKGIDVRVIAGVSFLDAAAVALGIDPLAEGMLLLDALELPAHGRRLMPQRPTLIAQVYDRRALSAAKLALLEVYPPGHIVRLVRGAGTTSASVSDVALEALDHGDDADHLTSIFVPALARIDDTRTFEGLRAVVAKLRDPDGGCPWDLEQTHESLRKYLLEEAYETLDALDAGEPHRFAEELGDLMMQVILHAQLAEDAGDFVIEDVIASITRKLIRRHPHVFAGVDVEDADEVLQNWERLKQDERGDTSVLDHVPRTMPALMQAQSLQSRASKAGLDAGDAERSTFVAAIDALAERRADADALGDLLFGIVAQSRAQGIDAEDALRRTIERYRARAGAEEASSRRA